MKKDRPPLTPEEVEHITGRLDDRRVAEIIATGATAEELLEAHTRVIESGEVAAEVQRAPAGVVAQLCEILAREAQYWDEER